TSSSQLISSYPPLLRAPQTPISDHRLTEEDDDSESHPLPVIDFQRTTSQEIGKACREWGMFRLINHQVPEDLHRQLHRVAAEIFNLSFEEKDGFPTTPVLYFWGSPAISMAGNANKTEPPFKNKLKLLEGFDVPLRGIARFHYQDPMLESFRCLLDEYGAHQTRLAESIFKAMAEDLNIPETKSSSYLSPATATLRVYRYLRRQTAGEKLGIPAHTDSSVISILHQDQVGGLQVSRNDKWFDVEPVEDTLIVNLGDMMQGISNDEYVSVKHRVKLNEENERISIGYFVFPAEHAVIESSNYRPFTFSEFHDSKESELKKLGFKIGL
ncbi:hypothetical protein M569_08430, partial [Genlisea aurea]